MICLIDRNLLLQAIRSRPRWFGVMHARLFIAALGMDLVALHQLGNPVLAHTFPDFPQIAAKAGGAIGAPTRLIGLPDLLRIHRAFLPRIVATPLDAQDPTQQGDGIPLSPLLD